ncbi:MAG: hypothetical protein GF347_02240 [Candidatus Moranbacteria bacterium]|nr:hypothetical protein [Candidatus Moranbacteria bacterium]
MRGRIQKIFNRKSILILSLTLILAAVLLIYNTLIGFSQTKEIRYIDQDTDRQKEFLDCGDHFSLNWDLTPKTYEPAIPLAEPMYEEIEIFKPFSFVAIGDAESYNAPTGFNSELISILENSRKLKPDFVIFTGDVITAHKNAESKIKNLKSLIEKYYQEYYICLDKHDIECGVPCIDLWSEIFWNKQYKPTEPRKLYMSFDYQNTHFVILSTGYPKLYSVDQKQLQWLESDLKKNNKENIIVIQHVPPVTFFKESKKECHDMSCSEPERSVLVSIFERYNVDLVISGHENSFEYQAVNGVHYILSGNTGNSPKYDDQSEGDVFSFVKVDENSITVFAVEVENNKNKIKETIKIK